MPKLIKDAAVIEDSWQLLADQASDIPDGPVIVPLALWLEKQAQLEHREQLDRKSVV